ncbi:hypothetical protein TTHERM_001276372 (macronuclear) [Tetrahymena thermophila SB210]|uniref:Uncharacterized protein n=1 Tax=Tetrahymena thermophila (strain SB210) TaxID=312017 RepID=W7X4B9_TETTS|nr:hypothetical protein TTHERM_001276372 [Tetrahymena thermophila SB210]EWS71253.1 hypothetical protein TTHERM_001276372 [Tetrahymena thermophila SB210]|eukprot:XP_012656213.1 hypothetical protein TTHERM_001276372 [Tetrahymena thermophila SB210]
MKIIKQNNLKSYYDYLNFRIIYLKVYYSLMKSARIQWISQPTQKDQQVKKVSFNTTQLFLKIRKSCLAKKKDGKIEPQSIQMKRNIKIFKIEKILKYLMKEQIKEFTDITQMKSKGEKIFQCKKWKKLYHRIKKLILLISKELIILKMNSFIKNMEFLQKKSKQIFQIYKKILVKIYILPKLIKKVFLLPLQELLHTQKILYKLNLQTISYQILIQEDKAKKYLTQIQFKMKVMEVQMKCFLINQALFLIKKESRVQSNKMFMKHSKFYKIYHIQVKLTIQPKIFLL